MPVAVVSSRSSQPVTVNALVENPRIIAERIIKVLSNQFATDQVLRNEGQATGGAVQYRVSSGLYADEASEIVEEFGEIPAVPSSVGDLLSVPTRKRALAVLISWEMRNRNAMGRVDNQITRLKNTLIRDIDGAFVTALLAAVTQTRAATAVWSNTSTATIRKDINAARRIVKTNQAAGTGSYSGYEPDTIVMSPLTEEDLLNSPEFLAMLFGSVNPSGISSLSEAPNGILGLKPIVTVGMPDNVAVVCESKTIGGYADERPLRATELYEWRPNETWRSDVSRVTAGFIDNPGAGCEITGIR